MIQRIQSIFLLLASCSLGSLFGLPFAKGPTNAGSFFQDGIYNILDNPFLLGLTIVGIIIALCSIFLFTNRSLQKRLSILGIIISIMIPVLAALLVYKEAHNIATDNIDDSLGLYVPVISILFFGFAIYYIKKDDQIINSMDRLR